MYVGIKLHGRIMFLLTHFMPTHPSLPELAKCEGYGCGFYLHIICTFLPCRVFAKLPEEQCQCQLLNDPYSQFHRDMLHFPSAASDKNALIEQGALLQWSHS